MTTPLYRLPKKEHYLVRRDLAHLLGSGLFIDLLPKADFLDALFRKHPVSVHPLDRAPDITSVLVTFKNEKGGHRLHMIITVTEGNQREGHGATYRITRKMPIKAASKTLQKKMRGISLRSYGETR